MENKIKEILSNRADYYIDCNGKSHDIIRGHPDDIMDEIVKLFAIPVVSQQRELLRAYHNYLLQNTDKHECLHTIDEFLEARNCG